MPGAMQSGERAANEVNTEFGGPPSAGTPTADFSASLTTGGAPLEVTFSDQSSEIPTSWSWNFGDSATSSAENPVHEYAAAGEYSVSLTATNASGSHTRVFPHLIAVPEPSLSAGLMTGVFTLLAMRGRQRRNADGLG